MIVIRNFILFFLVFCLLNGLHAQVSPEPKKSEGSVIDVPKNGIIKGKVIDTGTNSGMEYANISVFTSKDSRLVTGGITNASGVFEINGVPLGSYKIIVNFIGFEKMILPEVQLSPESLVLNLGNIYLKPDSKQIGAVEVVAERNRLEYKIDRKVVNVSSDINSAGGTAVTVLENTPSVEVDIDGNVSLRGSSNFAVLIDGRPSILSGSDALKQIPSSAIQNIEIITNPSVKYDPDGMAGIINVIMKRNVLSGINGIVNVNLGTGEKYGSDMLVNYKTKKYNLFLGASWNDNTDFGTMKSTRETFSHDTITYLNSEGRRDQSRKGKQLKGGIDYFPSENTTLTVSSEVGQYGFDSYSSGNLHNYEMPGVTDIYSVQRQNSGREGSFMSSSANFQTKFDKTGLHKLEGSFDYRYRKGNANETIDEYLADMDYHQTSEYLSRVLTDEKSTSNDYRMKLDYSLPLKNEAKFEAGLQSRMEGEKEYFNFMNYDPASQVFIDNPKYSSDMNFREDIHSVYSTFSGKLLNLNYQLGMRGEYTKRIIDHSKVSNPYVMDRLDYFPSAHFSYGKTEMTQYMVSYSRRINRPDGRDLDPFPSYMNQYTIRIGNPHLKPEYTDSYELSGIRKFKDSFISLETFFRTTKDLITHIQELKSDGIIYMSNGNLNRDYSLGGELMVNLSLSEKLLLNTSFSLYNYRLKGDVLGSSVDRQSTNYSGRINATYKFSPSSRLQLTGFYHGPSVSAQGNEKGMLFTNISYRQEFMKRKLTATISVRDVLGTMKMEGVSTGNDFKSTFRMQREPRVLMLTLTYKINSYKIDEEMPEEQETQGVDEID